MIKIGIIGYGAIGKDIASYISEGRAGKVTLEAILVRDKMKVSEPPPCLVLDQPEAFFSLQLDIVIEAAGHHSITQYGQMTLQSGSDIMIVSVGALVDKELMDGLMKAAEHYNKKIYIPSAAIGGLDRIAAASIHSIDEVKLITRKPVKAWYGTLAETMVDLHTITEPYCIFEGPALESAKLFPESVNVSAALSLASIGFEKTKVQVFVDPTINKNKHEIKATGYFGEISIEIQNTPSEANPKTGYIVAMSVCKVLKNLSTPLVIGI